MPSFLKVLKCYIVVLVCLFGNVGFISESAAQGNLPNSSSENSRTLQSKRLGKLVPYAGYEERLRQSPQWQTMTLDEQAKAIEKIVLAREQFLERRQQLQEKYENKIKKSRKLKEIIAGKWSTQRHRKEGDTLWNRYNNLPLKKRLHLERQLGLRNIRSSQLQEKFKESMDGLSYSKRNHILRQLQ